MDIDIEALRRAFQAEVEEDLATVEQALLVLEKEPQDQEHVASIFRKFHSLKGNAAGLGLERLSAFAHRIEDLLDGLRGGRQAVTPHHIGFLLEVVDAVRSILPALGAGSDALPAGAPALLDRLDSGHLEGGVETAEAEAEFPVEASRTLRIDVGRLDSLLSVTSEIAIARGRLELLIDEQGTPELAAAYRALERLLAQLHRSVSKVRMVPIAPLLRHYARVVRDLALTHHKQAELVIEDHGVEVDNSVIEQLRAPLTHMVRNAVHHGLETPSVRQAAGKRALGRVVLRARHDGSDIVVEVEDDGAGLDRGRILERARALGVATEAVRTPQDVDRLIFHQGLSTAREVSGTSGRGVGMDVVLRHVDALGGSVDVDSRVGEGCRFTVRMPLTLAVIEGLLARVATAPVVIPMAGVVRCLDLPAAEAEAADGVVNLRGQIVPFVRLRSVLETHEPPPPREVLVVIEKGHDRIGLTVDQLVGRAQVVLKPPGRFFSGLPAVSGLTILGDGRVAPVLNIAGLVDEHLHRVGVRSPEAAPAGAAGPA